MNKLHILSLLIFATITTHACEQQAVALPDWYAAHQTLCDDYRRYLKDQLEQYKTSPVEMATLNTMAHVIKQTHPGNDIIFTRDDYGNAFIHVAIEKEDENIVTALYNYGGWHLCKLANKNKETALDLCLKKLSPDAIISPAMRKITQETLKHMGCMADRGSTALGLLKKGLVDLIALDLMYQKQQKKLDGIPFNLFYVNATCKLCQDTPQTPLQLLASLYRDAADGIDGDTFTHLFVEQELPDELYELIQKDRVSFAKNKAQITPLDLALAKFREFTQIPVLIETENSSFTKRRCCVFMLLNYLKKNGHSQDTTFGNCCDKHKSIIEGEQNDGQK